MSRLRPFLWILWLITTIAACTTVTGNQANNPGSLDLVIYSGRSESLVGPLILRFEEQTGIPVKVRWGETAELAATLLEEGSRSPADIFFAQDPGGLGAVANMLTPLPGNIIEMVDQNFRDPLGRWVGISGRARVVIYNSQRLTAADLPKDMWGFLEPEWKGRIGWAPTNASFQSMVTAMRLAWGDEETQKWLEGILANQPITYEKNTPIVAAVASGEVDIGFVNHYYLYRFLAEAGPEFPVRNFFLSDGGPGSLILVAGAGVLNTSKSQSHAHEFIRFLLSQDAQEYFANQTVEYPLSKGVSADKDLPMIESLNTIKLDPADLDDLQGTVRLLRQVGAIP